MSDNVKCPICGSNFLDDGFDPCPMCGWIFDYEDYSEDDKSIPEGLHHLSFDEAKRLYENGKNIWGDPLPESKQ